MHKGRKVTTKGEIVRGDSFKPDCIYQMLQEIKSNFSLKVWRALLGVYVWGGALEVVRNVGGWAGQR